MKKPPLSESQIQRMQRLRDSGVSLRDIGKQFDRTGAYVCKHTKNPRLKSSREEKEVTIAESVAKERVGFLPKPVSRPRKDKEDFDREVRVLREVPSDFKVPSRVVGW